MVKKIKCFCSPDGILTHATFDTFNEQEGPDKGRRVKHYVYQDDENPNMYWHERVYLSEVADHAEKTYTEYVSERVFFGKVRLVKVRDGCLIDTWRAVAQCVMALAGKR